MGHEMPTTTPRTARKSGGDFTGQQGLKNNAAKQTELKEAASRMAVITAVEQEVSDSIIDYTNPDNPIVEVQVRQVEVNTPERVIVLNQDLDNVTWGRKVEDPGDLETGRPAVLGSMNMRSFKEGQKYKVERELAEHLNDRGYVAFMGAA
jgi:hypothetical protein